MYLLTVTVPARWAIIGVFIFMKSPAWGVFVFAWGFFLVSLADNVLKPLMLGRGVDAPMPIILLGALGGMATGGILGMFVGATLLALGYQIFMGWVAANPELKPTGSSGATAVG